MKDETLFASPFDVALARLLNDEVEPNALLEQARRALSDQSSDEPDPEPARRFDQLLRAKTRQLIKSHDRRGAKPALGGDARRAPAGFEAFDVEAQDGDAGEERDREASIGFEKATMKRNRINGAAAPPPKMSVTTEAPSDPESETLPDEWALRWCEAIYRSEALLRDAGLDPYADRARALADLIDDELASAALHPRDAILQRRHVRPVLQMLRDVDEPLRRRALRDSLDVKDANLTRLLNLLELDGLVVRRREGKERLIELTPAGRDLIETAVPTAADAMTGPPPRRARKRFEPDAEERHAADAEDRARFADIFQDLAEIDNAATEAAEPAYRDAASDKPSKRRKSENPAEIDPDPTEDA